MVVVTIVHLVATGLGRARLSLHAQVHASPAITAPLVRQAHSKISAVGHTYFVPRGPVNLAQCRKVTTQCRAQDFTVITMDLKMYVPMSANVSQDSSV